MEADLLVLKIEEIEAYLNEVKEAIQIGKYRLDRNRKGRII